MKFTCSVCNSESTNVEGREVWPRECGFYELLRLERDGCLAGYSMCSKHCAAILLETLIAKIPETKPTGKPCRTWKCEQCGSALPQHIYQNKNSKYETLPTVSQLVYPYECGKYHCFCSDKCLLANLKDSEITTKTE